MTRIADRKSRLTFETSETGRYRGKLREIVVDVSGDGYGLELRLKGARQRYAVSWAGVFNYAADRFARQQILERKQRRLLGKGQAA